MVFSFSGTSSSKFKSLKLMIFTFLGMILQVLEIIGSAEISCSLYQLVAGAFYNFSSLWQSLCSA